MQSFCCTAKALVIHYGCCVCAGSEVVHYGCCVVCAGSEVKDGGSASQSLSVSSDDCAIERLEHTVVHVKFSTTYRGDMSFHIRSPSGTDSEILSSRHKDHFEGGEQSPDSTVVE